MCCGSLLIAVLRYGIAIHYYGLDFEKPEFVGETI